MCAYHDYGASQIWWLLDLALFDFDIKYRVGKSNQAADALSQWPANPDSASESSDDEEEWEAISYEMVSQILDYHLDSRKIPCQVKHEVQGKQLPMLERLIPLLASNLLVCACSIEPG